MSKPSIGSAVTSSLENDKKQIIKELTVLKDNSEESIYSLIFSEAGNRSIIKNEP